MYFINGLLFISRIHDAVICAIIVNDVAHCADVLERNDEVNHNWSAEMLDRLMLKINITSSDI